MAIMFLYRPPVADALVQLKEYRGGLLLPGRVVSGVSSLSLSGGAAARARKRHADRR